MSLLEYGAENWIFVVALLCVIGMTYGIGANDVANSMGIPVGAKVLTLTTSIAFACTAELSGALLLGTEVSDTLRSKVIYSEQWQDSPYLLAIGFTAALFGTTLWLLVASLLKMPVSTTHSIVGAVVGFAWVEQGSAGIQWSTLESIVAAWFISPLLGALVSALMYWILIKLLLETPNPERAGQTRLWLLFFLTSATLWIFIVAKTNIPNMTELMEYAGALLCGFFVAMLYQFIFLPWQRRKMKDSVKTISQTKKGQDEEAGLEARVDSLGKALVSTTEGGVGIQSGASTTLYAPLLEAESSSVWERHSGDDAGPEEHLGAEVENQSTGGPVESQSTLQATTGLPATERWSFIRWSFSVLLLSSSWLVAFAHGANDVSNAIGPFAAIQAILVTGSVDSEESIPYWVLLVGSLGLCLGLSTLGYLVMQTVGEDITRVTKANGFCIQYGTAVTILLASYLGLPVSTTHTVIGSVLGVGMVKGGVQSIDLRVLRNIGISWLVTIPCAALPTILFFLVAKKLTHYS